MNYLNGFRLVSTLKQDGLDWQPAAAVNIAKGESLFDDGSGYATNVGTAFAATYLGVASAAVDNSGGAAGDLNVPIIPPRAEYEFWVPVEENTVIAQTNVGTLVDLQSNNTIDISDTTLVSWGFKIEGFDVSTPATNNNTNGYAKGRIVPSF